MNELPSASMGTNLLETSLSIVSGVAVLTWLGLAARSGFGNSDSSLGGFLL
jgi:hypothetical protein